MIESNIAYGNSEQLTITILASKRNYYGMKSRDQKRWLLPFSLGHPEIDLNIIPGNISEIDCPRVFTPHMIYIIRTDKLN